MWQDVVVPTPEESTLTCLKTSGGPSIPAGLEFLYAACRQLYPQQPNPLQVTAVIKYWLGGPDPLDYISMYFNPGNPELLIPPHWHYVSFGLSDLHGDGRVHEVTEGDLPSGFGFELTMRVKCEDGEKTPPTWPAALMQGLAKYVFQSESVFCAGDHVSWHCALDTSESRIQHMLISEDPQLKVQHTPFGSVQFVQIVGVTSEELQAAQRWNGCGVLNIMKRYPGTGGCWHITDMRRGESIFDLDPSVADEVHNGIEEEGSNLSGVSAKITWAVINTEGPFQQLTENYDNLDESSSSMTLDQSQEIKSTLRKGLMNYTTSSLGTEKLCFADLGKEKIEETASLETTTNELFVIQNLPSLHLTINLESGSLLPLALRGRLKHGRHFTFKSLLGVNAVTLLTPSVEGAFVSSSSPYAVKGPWLQVLIDEELLEKMNSELIELADPDQVKVPVTYEWPSKKLKITVFGEEL